MFRAKNLYRRLCIISICAFVLCGVYYWVDTRPYFLALDRAIVPVVVLSAAASLFILAFRPGVASRLRPLLQSWYPRIGLVACLGVLFLWAYFIRPRLALAPGTFRSLGSHEATDTLGANSLWNLGRYLSPITLFAGFAGFSWFLLSRRTSRFRWYVIPFVIVWLEYALFYIQDPRISADHPWAIRRFVPVVLPGFILFAFFFLDRIESVIRKRFSPVLLRTAVVIAMAAFLLRATPPGMFRREYAGSREFLTDLANRLPDDVPVFAYGSYMWKMPLRMVFDKPLFFLDLNKKSGRRAAARIAERLSAGKCAILHDYSFPHVSGPEDSLDFKWTLERIQPSQYPLAHKWIKGSFRIGLDFVDDAKVLIGVNSPWLGGQKVPSVAESGFWGQEYDGTQPFRWTKATATLDIPLEDDTSPRSLRINYKGINPKGSDVVVKVNGKELFNKHVTGQSGTLVVEGLEQAGITDHMDVSIQSTPFRPVDFGMGTDDRELGIRITFIEIDDGED